MIAELKVVICEARRAERAAHDALGPLGRQRGENKRGMALTAAGRGSCAPSGTPSPR